MKNKDILDYYNSLAEQTSIQYKAASKAKEKGYDISKTIECPPAEDLADRTEKIIGPKGIAKRYREVLAEKKDRRRNHEFIFHQIQNHYAVRRHWHSTQFSADLFLFSPGKGTG